MLQRWSKNDQVLNGYPIIVASPAFPANPVGYFQRQDDRTQPDYNNPYWSYGTGTLPVKYPETSRDFWSLVKQYKPIAIMSFSRGDLGRSWELEGRGLNRPQGDWLTSLPYIRSSDGMLVTETFAPPIAGGTAGDYSPFANTKPGTANQPNPTADPNTAAMSNLPTDAIIAAIKKKYPNSSVINPYLDSNSADVAGSFVSEFMAYHVAWYRQYINAKYAGTQDLPNYNCLFSGHTHVGVNLPVATAADAVAIQLGVLVGQLP